MGLRGRTQFLDKNCFFVTTTCYKWYKLLEINACKDIVINSISFLNIKYKADVLGYVVMPNHIHLIIYFKELNNLSNWMRDLKKFTAVMIRKEIEKCGFTELVEKLRLDKPSGQVFNPELSLEI